MIRLFNVYYPVRTLVLLLGEALIVGSSFVLGTRCCTVESMFRLNNELFIERGYLRILALTGVVLLLSHGFDLYDSSQDWAEAGSDVPDVVCPGPGGTGTGRDYLQVSRFSAGQQFRDFRRDHPRGFTVLLALRL